MANTSKGYSAKIGLDISDCDKKINALNRELGTIDKSMKQNGESAELLSQKYTVMGEKAQALADKLKTLEGSRGDVINAFNNGEISSEDLRAYEREVENTKGELKGMIPSLGDMSKAFDVLGEALKKVTQLTAAFVRESIEVGKQFESSMSQVAATMAIEKTSEDFEMLSEKAKKMGATTRYTASEAADALNYLALAGYNAEAAITGLDSVMALAQAGGMELARASDMITDTLSALHLYVKEDMETTQQNMEELVNKMAKTAQRSNTSVSQLGDALLTVGGTAANMAGGLTEINTMLGVLADNGIKASEGGTHLRNILLKMSKPTKNMKALMETLNMEFYDLEGNLRPIPDIFLEMKQKMDDMGLTQAEKDSLINKAFNPTDIASVNALLGTTAERFDELAGEIENADNAASTMADTMNQNLDGALRTLNSAKEAVEVEFYEKINEPLAEIVNNVAIALQDISGEISEAGFGEEFTEALQKISDAVKDALPKGVDLFRRFAEEVVPRLGDVATKIVDITADEVLPRMLDLFEWLIDHSSEVETGIKMIVTAMAAGKVMDFTNNLFGTVTQLTNVATGATNAAGAILNATANMGAQTAALGGAGGLLAKMNLYVLAFEAVVTAALIARDAIEKATEAMIEQSKVANGFSDYSNDLIDEYAEIATGKSEKTAEQLRKDIAENQAELDHMEKQLQYLKKLGDEAEETGNWDKYNEYYRKIGFDEDQLDRNIEVLKDTIFQEKKLLNEREVAEKEASERDKRNTKQAEENARRREEAEKRNKQGSARAAEIFEERNLHAIGEATEAEKQAFAELLEAQEEEWDEQYHWDKKNQEAYWREREQFLKENEINSKEWHEAWNETEAKLGKLDSNTQKEISSNLKDAEKAIKDKLTSFKNDLDLAVAGGKDEYEANEELGRWLNENLDHTSELYKTEYTKYLEKKKSLNDDIIKKQDQEYEDNKKKQEELIKKEFEALEVQATNEDWTERKLLNEKYRLLNKYKDQELIYLEVYEDTHDELIKTKADLDKKEREAEKAQAEKNAEDREKIMESAQKEAEDLIKKYYTSSYDDMISSARSSKTVTDSSGKERLVFTDYGKKLQELKVYQKNLKKLGSLNLSAEHLKEIFSMDLDTRMKYISELLQMSGDQRARYLSDYNKYQKAAASTAQTELTYRSDEIKTEVENKYDELVKDASISGDAAAKAYADAWNAYIKNTPLQGIVLPSKITAGADNYSKGIIDTSKRLMDTVNGLLGTTINVNIDNKKTVTQTLGEYLKKQQNAGSKAV